jgi:hypothetical protein
MESNMKIIFLDIDGVLNSETDFVEVSMYGHTNNEVKHTLKNGREIIAPLCRGKLALLELIIKQTDAKIVISSTWRDHFKLSTIHDMFKAQGFTLPRTVIVGKTEPSRMSLSTSHTEFRCGDIADWLENRDDVESYVILDDIPSRLFYEPHNEHLVTTSEYDGLNRLDVNKAMNILGRNEEAQKAFDEYNKSLDMLINCMC